ncbi:MAG: hypothetical protein M9936_14300 [Caldilinea sp.]|nr:hypothetical protein [Caldilinea sp.]MCB0146275.1 hypothetical protein [Caldilineaceae bacterium]MCO5210860.1 hypothetical protein [Caldilinea sp.]MCW5842704.1 hypothetical protein [Caldilinea sp.]
MNTYDRRAGELLALAIAEGIDLPMPVDEIIAWEDAGHAIDLVTGEILLNADSVRIAPTVAGEATAFLLELEEVTT